MGILRAASELTGRGLAALFAAVLVVRRPRPIHPKGLLLSGRITWRSKRPAVASGIAWIDKPPASGGQPVIARLSRSVGLPSAVPDIIGLALRVETSSGPADLELASTGFDLPARFLLLPHRSPGKAWLGTLFPYRGTSGPVLIAARTRHPRDLPSSLTDVAALLTETEWVLDLYFATPRGKWRPFADVRLSRDADPFDSLDFRFDAVDHPLPGAGTYDWAARVRQRSYRLARRSDAGS